VSVIVIRFCIYVAPHLKLIAWPGEHRKHDAPTPVIGGVGVFISIGFTCLILDIPIKQYQYLFYASLCLLLVGAIDDVLHLSSTTRFIIQIIAALVIVFPGQVELETLGRLFSLQEVILGNLGYLFTIFAVIGVINAINMTDGLDGLLGTQFILIFGGLYLLVLNGAYETEAPMLLALIVSVLAFLFFNLRVGRPRAKLFLGDAGSMFLGLVVSWYLIRFSQKPVNIIEPVTALWFIALPLSDTITVMLRRISHRLSPFDADRTHIHHLLLHKGFSVNQVVSILSVVGAVLLIVGLVLQKLGVAEYIRFYVALSIFTLHMVVTTKYIRKHNLAID